MKEVIEILKDRKFRWEKTLIRALDRTEPSSGDAEANQRLRDYTCYNSHISELFYVIRLLEAALQEE